MAREKSYTVESTEIGPGAKFVNSLLDIARRMGPNLLRFDRDAILDWARRRTGLHDLGDGRYVEVLGNMIENAKDTEITPMGEFLLNFIVRKTAVNRLRIEDHIKRHPGIEDTPVISPMFVIGLARTGTTLLQNVLSTGPGYRALRLWELATPYPLHRDRERDRRMRLRKADLPLRLMRAAMPDMAIAHDVRAETKEECWILLANTLVLTHTDLVTGLHGWNEYLVDMDRSWVFEEYKRMLQLLAYVTPTKRFVLKCPTHIWNIEPILEVFPDACLIWTHRDPVKSIASACSLISIGRKLFLGRIDPRKVGEMIEDRTHSVIRGAMKARENAGDESFYDVNFETLVRDIPAEVARIRDHFGLPHEAKHEEEVRKYLEKPRKDKPGKHRYGPEQFHLSPEEIEERFGEYIDRFGIDTA